MKSFSFYKKYRLIWDNRLVLYLFKKVIFVTVKMIKIFMYWFTPTVNLIKRFSKYLGNRFKKSGYNSFYKH